MRSLATKTIVISTFLVLIPFIFPQGVIASGSSLSVSPSTIKIEAKPPADVWTPFTLTNKSDQSITLTVGYKAFDPQASQNGNVVFLHNDQTLSGQDKNIFQKIQVVDDKNISHDTIVLGPQQKERFRLRILLPENEPTGDSYFSLIFLGNRNKSIQNDTNNDKSNQDSSSSLQLGIGLNVLLAIGDKEIARATITNFSTSWFKKSGPVAFLLSLQNNGLHFITPHGNIIIKNMFGQSIGKVNVPKTVLLAGTTRTISSTDINASANQQLLWPEHFLLGIYSATLSLSLSDKGPSYTRTIHFVAVPLAFIGYFIAFIIIIWYIFSRIKKKI